MLTDKTEVADKSCSNNSERILQRDLVETFLNTFFKIGILSNYTISDNGIIDVDGNIYVNIEKFNHEGINVLPIQFGHITGNFEIQISNIKKLKGVPHTVDGYFSIDNCKNIKSLEFFPKCNEFSCHDCTGLESLDGLNCEKFIGWNLNLKRFGINFSSKYFSFNNFPTPTADEMRRFIQLNPTFITDQEAPWITLIKDYSEHKDMFIAIAQFEELYNEPWLKPENRIEFINSDLTMGL